MKTRQFVAGPVAGRLPEHGAAEIILLDIADLEGHRVRIIVGDEEALGWGVRPCPDDVLVHVGLVPRQGAVEVGPIPETACGNSLVCITEFLIRVVERAAVEWRAEDDLLRGDLVFDVVLDGVVCAEICGIGVVFVYEKIVAWPEVLSHDPA